MTTLDLLQAVTNLIAEHERLKEEISRHAEIIKKQTEVINRLKPQNGLEAYRRKCEEVKHQRAMSTPEFFDECERERGEE